MGDFSLKRVLIGVWLGFPAIMLISVLVLGSLPSTEAVKDQRPATAQQEEAGASEDLLVSAP